MRDPIEYFIRVGWEQNRAVHPSASPQTLFRTFVSDYCSDYVPHSEFIELLATYGITP